MSCSPRYRLPGARVTKRLLLAFALLLCAQSAFAAQRFYLLPKTGDGLSRATGFQPKYLEAAGIPVLMSMSYGREPVYLVLVDVTAGQHTALSGNADVVALPLNLDTTVGGQLATVQNALETLKIPGQWVTAQTTYRQVVNMVERIFRLWQKLDGLYGMSVFASGATLNTTLGQLTQTQRDRLKFTAGAFGVDTSGASANTTLRQAIKAFADAMPGAKGGIGMMVSP